MISDVCFVTDDVAYAQIKRKLNRDGTLFFFYPGWMRLMFTCGLGRYVGSSLTLVPKPFGGRGQRRWTAERKL